MKTIAILVITFLILISLTASAVEDFTPTTTQPTQPGVYTTFDPICSQNSAGISQIISKQEKIEQTCGKCFKQADLSKFEQAVDEKFDDKIGRILANMITLLLLWTAFFFAIQFLMVSKGWLAFGPKPINPEPVKKKPKEKPKEKEKEEPKEPPKEEEKPYSLSEVFEQIEKDEWGAPDGGREERPVQSP